MRNIIRTALVIGTLATPMLASADEPKKDAAPAADKATPAPAKDAKAPADKKDVKKADKKDPKAPVAPKTEEKPATK
jgi:uncharacterized protein involved in copper resistance